MNSFTLLMGSNFEPKQNIDKAKDLLSNLINVESFSSIRRSKAEGIKAQTYDVADYYNLICEGSTPLDLDILNKKLKQIENDLGRIRNIPENIEISMDIDIVIWNKKIIRLKDYNADYFQNCLLKD